jgi:hypothetical protein
MMIGSNLGFYAEILMAGVGLYQSKVNVYYFNHWVDLRTGIGVSAQ